MKRSLFALTALVALAVMSTGCAQKTQLFNGTDFTGWKLHVDDENIDVKDIWSVKDGVVHCKGKPNGYMRTTETYSNYKLHVEWRWPAQPTNSGVFLHSSGKDKVWPRCIEAQLKAGNAGDFVLINHTGVTIDGKEYQDDNKMFVRVPKKLDSTENEPGEWNEYDITCKGDTITVLVNGQLQNVAVKATDTEGWICLQSEGASIQFRNIYLEDLNE
jgi:hypothetical protein